MSTADVALPSSSLPHPSPWRFVFWCRWAFTIVSFCFLVFSAWQIKQLIHNETLLSGNAQINAIPYNEPTKAAVAQKLEGAKGLFQITMIVMAVLWGLVIAKKDERALLFSKAHLPELLMFVFANLLFAASAFCYSSYTDAMSSVHIQGAVEIEDSKDVTIMDFREPRINNYYVWQERIWVAAMVVTGLALASAHGIRTLQEEAQKEKPQCDTSPSSPSCSS